MSENFRPLRGGGEGRGLLNTKGNSMGKRLQVLTETMRRFPAASLLAVLNVVFVAWATGSKDEEIRQPLSCLYSSGLAIVFSAAVELLAERFKMRRIWRDALQGCVLVIFGLLVASFSDYGKFETHFFYTYYLSFFAFVALTACALCWHQKVANVFPAVSFAGMIGFAAAFAVGGGLALVLLAIEKLFGTRIGWSVYSTLWGGAFAAIGTEFFLAYSTRMEPFEFPKVWKVLFVYVVLPIYMLLLCVLWVYLAKCVILWKLPNGQVNWLVTTASSIWIALYLMLAPVENRLVVLFRRWGAALVIPLIVLQVCALAIRIGEYGLTPSRYASILFVVFTSSLAAITLVWHSRANVMAYVLFAAVALFGAHSHWNIVDTGVRAQIARLTAFAERRLAGEKFEKKDRFEIMGAWEFTKEYACTNGHYRSGQRLDEDAKRDFKAEWGFDYCNKWERSRAIEAKDDARVPKNTYYNLEIGKSFSTEGYKSVCKRRITEIDGSVFLESTKDKSKEGPLFDATLLKEALDRNKQKGEVVYLDLADGRRIVFASLSVEIKEESPGSCKFNYVFGECLVFEK